MYLGCVSKLKIIIDEYSFLKINLYLLISSKIPSEKNKNILLTNRLIYAFS